MDPQTADQAEDIQLIHGLHRMDTMKTVGVLRKTRHRGTERVGWMFTFVAAAYNLVRLPKLLAGVA